MKNLLFLIFLAGGIAMGMKHMNATGMDPEAELTHLWQNTIIYVHQAWQQFLGTLSHMFR